LTVEPVNPLAALERWLDHGAQYRVLELSSDGAVLELRTCHGEPVDRLESRDERLLSFLRERADEDG
jgi:hypothetical protein